MLYYFPLEPVSERYSVYLSTPDGFWETFLKEKGIAYKALRPWDGDSRIRVGSGCVLDTTKRCVWAMRQVEMFLELLDSKQVKHDDVVYIEDSWHPGIEALFYARDMYKIRFKTYAWFHANSWDDSDFTVKAGMKPWMLPFDKAIANALDGCFCADVCLKEMMAAAGCDTHNVYPVGTIWNTKMIREKYGYNPRQPKTKTVVFASRWDAEKNPSFFCELAERVWAERQDIQFVVTTGFPQLVSNQAWLLDRAKEAVKNCHGNFQIKTNVSKADYFKFLNTCKVQLNCGDHDNVSYGLLESCSQGCLPLFSNRKTFPMALHYDTDHLFNYLNLADCRKKLYKLIDREDKPYPMDHIFSRFDNSIQYVAHMMGLC